jgi:hypothetical protein
LGRGDLAEVAGADTDVTDFPELRTLVAVEVVVEERQACPTMLAAAAAAAS